MKIALRKAIWAVLWVLLGALWAPAWWMLQVDSREEEFRGRLYTSYFSAYFVVAPLSLWVGAMVATLGVLLVWRLASWWAALSASLYLWLAAALLFIAASCSVPVWGCEPCLGRTSAMDTSEARWMGVGLAVLSLPIWLQLVVVGLYQLSKGYWGRRQGEGAGDDEGESV